MVRLCVFVAFMLLVALVATAHWAAVQTWLTVRQAAINAAIVAWWIGELGYVVFVDDDL